MLISPSLEDVNPNTTFYSYYFFPRAPRRESRCFFFVLVPGGDAVSRLSDAYFLALLSPTV